MGRCGPPAAARMCWCGIPTASGASSSIRSARRTRGRRGSRSPRCAFLRGAPLKKWCLGIQRRWRGWPTSPASSCIPIRFARTISIILTSSGSISTRCRVLPGTRSSTWRASSVQRWKTSSSQAGRRPQDREGCTSTFGSNGAGPSTRCAGRRSLWRARSSGARPPLRRASGGRKSAMACSSTTTRTRRTAPSPPRTPSGRHLTRVCRRR